MTKYLTRRLNSPEITAATPVIEALMLSAKNVRNSTIFIINNILTAYQYNESTQTWKLKARLQVHQRDSLALINTVIPEYNRKLLDKAATTGKNVRALNLFDNEITSATRFQLLNHSLIEQTLKYADAQKTESLRSYTSTHSYIAQATLQHTVDEYKHYFKALATYFKNPKSFTGCPRVPYYSSKNDHVTIELDQARLNKAGSLMCLEKFKLFRTFPDKDEITDELKKAYEHINFKRLIEEDIRISKLKGKLKTIRFVALKNARHSVKVEYVIELDKKETGECARVLKQNNEFFSLSSAEQNRWVSEYYSRKPLPRIMGIDIGHTNWVTLTCSDRTAGDNRVVSAREYLETVDKIDIQIDHQKSVLAKKFTEYGVLSKKRLDKIKLTKSEQRKLREFEIAINSDAVLKKLWRRKNQFIKDYLHKLSDAILEEATLQKNRYIVVGKNKFWKQESNMRASNNRRAHNLPHTRLIALLRYKARLRGIVLLETEESYTSKTSFITNEELKQYAPESTDGKKTNSQLQGTRHKLLFKIGNRQYHADINGSFNIIRKVFKRFAYDRTKVSLRYVLSELKLYGKTCFRVFYQLSGALARAPMV